jgi:hypothetical protein
MSSDETDGTEGKLEGELMVVLDDGAYMPERAHATDAGADLRTPRPF